MDIKKYHPSEQIDPAVDLGVIPPPLPPMVTGRELLAKAPPPPPQIIEGILHLGCKMILGGTSKSNKSWCLLDLAASVASGQSWWGRQCTKAKVVYINFELQQWAMAQRLRAIRQARPECKFDDHLTTWNLRGRSCDLSVLRPELEKGLIEGSFGMIIMDPAYKVLGNRDENANGEIANLMNELETLAQSSGAAVVIAHHFAKGDSSAKFAMDRMSGAGAWARDPDSILILTPHEEESCFTVTSILRNLPMIPEFVVEWNYPVLKVVDDLDPESLRRQAGRKKAYTDREFMEKFLTSAPKSRKTILDEAEADGVSRSTVDRYLRRLAEAGAIASSSGLYWRKHQGE